MQNNVLTIEELKEIIDNLYRTIGVRMDLNLSKHPKISDAFEVNYASFLDDCKVITDRLSHGCRLCAQAYIGRKGIPYPSQAINPKGEKAQKSKKSHEKTKKQAKIVYPKCTLTPVLVYL